MFDQNEALCSNNEDFDQTYLNTGLKTQNVEVYSLDLITLAKTELLYPKNAGA